MVLEVIPCPDRVLLGLGVRAAFRGVNADQPDLFLVALEPMTMVSPSVIDKTSAGRVRVDLSARRPEGRRRAMRMRIVGTMAFRLMGHGEATKLAVIAQLGTGKTIREVAKINGMSTATVLRFKQELGSVDTINQEVNTLKKGLSRKVWRIGDMPADSVINHPEVIENAALSQRMVGLGIAVDKGR